jgi:hypothetical protein
MQPSDAPPLLDDAGFLAELERLDYLKRRPVGKPMPDSARVTSRFDEAARERAHAALERALEPEYHSQQPRHVDALAAQRPGSRMSRALVVLAVVLGFVAGAGVAGVIFHDRIAEITAQRVHLR